MTSFCGLSPFPEETSHVTIDGLVTQGERLTARAMWVGMADSVLLIKVALPALFRSPTFQVGNLFATLSIKG